MKSELAKVTRVGEPLPQPAPMSPPVDIPNMPVSSCQEPPAALYTALSVAWSQPLMRCWTWLRCVAANQAAGRNRAAPMSSQEGRSVATYSTTTNRPNSSTEEPRSFCRTRTQMLTPHTMNRGPRCRARGRLIHRTLRPARARLSRLATR